MIEKRIYELETTNIAFMLIKMKALIPLLFEIRIEMMSHSDHFHIPHTNLVSKKAQLFSTNKFSTNTFCPNTSSLITLKLIGLILINPMSFSRYLFSLVKVCNEVVCIYNRL